MTNKEMAGALRQKVASSKVRKGQTWTITEPNGARRTFEIRLLQMSPGGARARGRDQNGKQIMCPVRRLERGDYAVLEKEVSA